MTSSFLEGREGKQNWLASQGRKENVELKMASSTVLARFARQLCT